MIVPMKKITVIVQAKDTQEALESLRTLGVVHVEHQVSPAGDKVSSLKAEEMRFSRVVAVLADIAEQKQPQENEKDTAEKILTIIKEKEYLYENILRRQRHIDQWQEWGDFDPALIEDFKNKNLLVRLARIHHKRLKEVPKGVIVHTLFKKGAVAYCALISQEEIDLPFETLALPKTSLASMLTQQDADKQRIQRIESALNDYAHYKQALVDYTKRLSARLQFQETSAGMGKFETLSYLRGYIPHDVAPSLEESAQRQQWALLIEEPELDDNVPTLIRNPRWVQIIKPVFDIIKALPGYKEVDISLWFLLFFSVFFGILIGDAGYGMVVFALTLFLHARLKKSLKDTRIFTLTYILSTSAIIWGVLTGTFFGQAWLAQHLQPLLPQLNNSRTVQALCFLIGAVHLSIAHVWRGLMKFPHLKFLSEAGWICLLWTGFFLARTLILDEAFPNVAKGLLISGAILIVLFTNPSKQIVKSFGSGLQDLLLNAVNSFTDVVSYIRLFAVGVATVAVADAFNQMAATAGGSGVVGGLITVVILLLGHTLNIALCAMAVLVHGVRLNVLEFSSHLNMEWSGMPYDPFKNKE
ncbi:V-type ATP synthase subunit I [Candidatus Omnitrophota bacterium]